MSELKNDPRQYVFVMVDIVRYLDDSYPGFVECRLIDAFGREWFFHDKVPVVTCADIDASSPLPQPGVIACEIIETRVQPDGRTIISIDTKSPWYVDATTGDTLFDVYAEQLIIRFPTI